MNESDTKINVRLVSPGDSEGFARLMRGFLGYAGNEPADTRVSQSLLCKAVDASSNYTVLVAEQDGVLVGMVSLTIAESSYKASCFGWADDFYVEESRRSSGIGKKLLNKLIEVARARSCSNVLVGVGETEERTLKFYEVNGFKDMHCKLLTMPLG